MSRPDFWNDPERAQNVGRQREELAAEFSEWDHLRRGVSDALEIARLDQKDQSVTLREELETQHMEFKKKFDDLEFAVLLSEKFDAANAVMAIHAGAGGTDAADWAEILLRMYTRFFESRGWKAQIVDISRGGEAGIKSAIIMVTGRYAYGYLKSEAGVHRLVRISPFDAEKMRHTSFALVEVLPQVEQAEEVTIDQKDLRVDTFLASGHGGQNIQKTESAVRVTHLPTGIVVAVQNERSQQQNRETAMNILRARILERVIKEREAEMQKLRGEYKEAAWGNQIRSYVLHPYQLVKDHRTKLETAETSAVLNGELLPFMESYLRWVRAGRPVIKGGKEED
ncbi:MAG: Peptide chain release factor 2 [Candidatus Magasanikbacteria bacterium]|nr:Peptide chain release factor 2 [Candidatus Magasanikbacteria bacterium]